MKAANITNVIKKFLDNADRTILIDGPWGVGKTHYILEFLKEAKKEKMKLKVSYVSVFGKSTIDEIHTELYKAFHPHRARLFGYQENVKNPMLKSPFLLSDSEKIELFKSQFDYIYSFRSLENVNFIELFS